ncbi:PREDICTED: uncharacterized protein LOC109131143 [Camelina sativa]|uniref:Uncharacterized protein LOC109131143 n=1 Tax=Camelina sativa TaxID=90675 RepID=A0ABM1RE78_CAMSA|nr:PREDICTED: uncharacterized protein LOC109131143 [Camelina sativa]
MYKQFSPDIMFLMETKNSDAVTLKAVEGLNFACRHLVPPQGHGGGGLALLWKQDVDIEILVSGSNFVDTKVLVKGKSFYATFVYGDPDHIKRRRVWEALKMIAESREEAWFLYCDFNDIVDSSEKSGGPSRPEGSFVDFRSFLAECDLYDLRHTGNFLSWRGNRHSHLVFCRLDRALSNSSWATMFPNGRVEYLRFEGSDHRPILIHFALTRQKRRGMFRYDRRLKDNEEVKQLVASTWLTRDNTSVQTRIANCRRALVKWNKEKHRNSQLAIKRHQYDLEKAMTNPIQDEVLLSRINETLKAAYKDEESFWKQRSRQLWLSLGDQNTCYFHAATRGRKAINNLEEDPDLENTIEEALSPRISEEVNQRLIAVPSTKEIRDAVFDIHPGKAPGPDGFSACFFHSNWEAVGPAIVAEIQEFFVSGVMPYNLNETYIRLIPKGQGAKKVADFRPIALCNVYYKAISKLLARRLQPVLASLVSENQSAFIPGRAISDNVLITHEMLHFLKTSGAEVHCAMAVKSDMSKAYDRVEWCFVQKVLKRLGFHPLWIKWVMQCITTVSYSFLVNDTPRGKVKPLRGIRQGDPLSPYIFILCSEVLSGLCNKAQRTGQFPGFRVARGSPKINHLLFADDTMFFTKSSEKACLALMKILGNEVLSGLCNKAQRTGQFPGFRVARGSPKINHLLFADDTMFFTKSSEKACLALMKILGKYGRASGQQINAAKSSISFSKKTSAERRARVKQILGISKEGGVGKYLGLPEHFGRTKKDLFSAIVDRIRQRAFSLSNKFLSSAGKLTLLKSVLAAMPSYAMSCFQLPKSLCKRIQSVLTRFWWDTKAEKKGMCWIAWDKLTHSKQDGGLGLRDLQDFNAALLGKIGWRILNNLDCLLARVLLGKYCTTTSFLDSKCPSSASHGWRSILVGRDLIKKKLGWVVGDGQDIRIWQDPWLSTSMLTQPMGPAPMGSKDWRVKDLFLTNSFDWDESRVREVLPDSAHLILPIKPSRLGARDRQVWVGNPSGEYSTKSGYFVARSESCSIPMDPLLSSVNYKAEVWSLHISPKVKMFLWKAIHGALATGAQLHSRGIPAEEKCSICGRPESVVHLLFHCPFAVEVWRKAPFQPFEICQVITTVKDGLVLVNNLKFIPPIGLTSGLLAPWICWSLWKSRNQRVFNSSSISGEDTLLRAILDAKEWTTDGAWRQSTKEAGIGWTITNHVGITSHHSAVCEHVSSPLMVEALACRADVLEAIRLGGAHLLVESDCQQLVGAINARSVLLEVHGVLSNILIASSSLSSFVCRFIPRTANSVADSLAKQSLLLANSYAG